MFVVRRLDIDAQSKQQEETKNINVSLHTFGNVTDYITLTHYTIIMDL